MLVLDERPIRSPHIVHPRRRALELVRLSLPAVNSELRKSLSRTSSRGSPIRGVHALSIISADTSAAPPRKLLAEHGVGLLQLHADVVDASSNHATRSVPGAMIHAGHVAATVAGA